jgi:hypothetical protein
VVAAAAAGRTLEAWAGTVGLTVAVRSCVGDPAGVVIADIPEASAAAWEGTVAHILGAGTHLAAAVVECRVHIGRYCMPVAASWGCGVDPCCYHFGARSPDVVI